MKIFKWIKRILFGALALISLSLIIGFIFEKVSRSYAEKIIPDGQFADVGGHQLHYLKKGGNSATVVFETAFDPAGHLQWYNLQKEISKFATQNYIDAIDDIKTKLIQAGVDPEKLRTEAAFKKAADQYDGYRAGITAPTRDPNLFGAHKLRKPNPRSKPRTNSKAVEPKKKKHSDSIDTF